MPAEEKDSQRTRIILQIIAIMMLLVAVGDLSYSYYHILRWFITGITVYLFYFSYIEKKIGWIYTFALLALLFNPFLPFYFYKETWVVFDIITAIIIFVSIFALNTIKK